MNVLLIFVSLTSLFSVIKDFIDSNWEWENKNIVSVFLFLCSIIPTLVNAIIYLNSDRSWKVLLINLYKFFLMDYFEDYLIKCNIFEKPFFCNIAVLGECIHYGGKQLVLGTNPQNLQIHNNIKYLKGLFIKFDLSKLDFANNSGLDNFYRLLEDKVSKKNCDILCVSYMTLRYEEDEVSMRFENREHNIGHTTKITNDDWYLKIQELFPAAIDFGSTGGHLNEKIGPIFVKLLKTSLILGHEGSFLRNIDFCDDVKLFVNLFFCIKFWAENNLKGVIGEGNPGVRKGASILHCYNFTEIIDRLSKGAILWIDDLEVKKYFVEGESFRSDFVYCMVEKLIGESNCKILKELVCLRFNPEEVEVLKLVSSIASLNSQINIRRYVTLPNHKLKKFLVDVSYFFSLIKYGKINYTDKNLCVSREAAQICRKHTILNPENSVVNKSLMEFKEEIIDNLGKEKKAYIKKHVGSKVGVFKKINAEKVSTFKDNFLKQKEKKAEMVSRAYLEALKSPIPVNVKSDNVRIKEFCSKVCLRRIEKKEEAKVLDHSEFLRVEKKLKAKVSILEAKNKSTKKIVMPSQEVFLKKHLEKNREIILNLSSPKIIFKKSFNRLLEIVNAPEPSSKDENRKDFLESNTFFLLTDLKEEDVEEYKDLRVVKLFKLGREFREKKKLEKRMAEEEKERISALRDKELKKKVQDILIKKEKKILQKEIESREAEFDDSEKGLKLRIKKITDSSPNMSKFSIKILEVMNSDIKGYSPMKKFLYRAVKPDDKDKFFELIQLYDKIIFPILLEKFPKRAEKLMKCDFK